MLIEDLDAEAATAALPMLAAILRACVEGGASVNFVLPFTQQDSEAWWRRAVLPGLAARDRRLLVARDGTKILGTVQLAFAPQPNQAHRADVTKLLVHPEGRRRGVGRALMLRLEDLAREEGRSLLVLDTVEGSAAQRLYESLGWTLLGVVPRFALSTDRTRLEGSAFFWKELDVPHRASR
ncbi:GNAT family N-acetyltransferase [Falsiroseomonas bella]|uniref:GNAT family N-acetyltransferase n=1 Tax=Falsiroseomonas bella TaxID=2184016 RepID=A0A317FJE0_9PROT|nr:GNAT family N-acetyltransferase [Falsiroseomonas bella]PWS39171.1 GNAT family N-acetyltransferase [Falsiroseomonas bella]